MESGSIGKTLAGAASLAVARPDASPNRAAKTDLTPEAVVQPVGETEAVRFEPSGGAKERAALEAALQSMIQRNLTIDPKTREVVFQAVNERTGEVVRQFPDEAILRLRAYTREMETHEAEAGPSRDAPRVEKIA